MNHHVVLIDNYDSFTFNLAQLFAGLRPLRSVQVTVVRNDAIDVAGLRALAPTHIVLSPGPGIPERRRDFGVCGDVLREAPELAPVLGVCLGHQGIAHALGGRVVRAPEPVHGKVSPLVPTDGGGRLLQGLDAPLHAMRYHSWVVEESSLPASLAVTARSPCGLVMAMEHRSLPIFGVQFHPESVGSPLGPALARRFLAQTRTTDAH